MHLKFKDQIFCTALKASDGKPCGNKARYVYQSPLGHREYLCGRHSGPLVSRYVREINP